MVGLRRRELTGRGRAFPGFDEVRSHDRAGPKLNAYRALREDHPELGLSAVRSASAVDESLAAWEAANADRLEEARINATHLFGVTGGSRLNGRVDFVLVPAVADPEAETRDARGTLLRQLLDHALGQQSDLRARLADLGEKVAEEARDIVDAEGGQALVDLSTAVTDELARLVPGGHVQLEARPLPVRVPELAVDLRVADGQLQTGVGRQGHGFQRALLIALVQRLAALRPRAGEAGADDGHRDATEGDQAGGGGVDGSSAPGGASRSLPTLFLALEEPELYQHPLQARHFASTLAELADGSGGAVQIAYATHSEHFVDPSHYHRLRRFRRQPGRAWPEAAVTQAVIERVAARLADAYEPSQIPLRVRLTLRRQVAEAVFATAALIVEGTSDAGLLHGVADREGGFDSMGVAVVVASGKRPLLIPWAILTELGVPAYVVFDGDAGVGARMIADGKTAEQAAAEAEKQRRENELVLSALGGQPELVPSTVVTPQYAMFEDTLEAESARWEGFAEGVAIARQEVGEWRGKSEDAYRQAAASLTAPSPFRDILEHVRGLAG